MRSISLYRQGGPPILAGLVILASTLRKIRIGIPPRQVAAVSLAILPILTIIVSLFRQIMTFISSRLADFPPDGRR